MLRFSRIFIILFAVIVLTGGCNANNQKVTDVSTKDQTPMVLIPAGDFTMGIRSHYQELSETYTVWLDDYYIDIYEVTNSAYNKCVTAGVCNLYSEERSERVIEEYYDNPAYKNYPVIGVTWNDAKTFCEWRGARLPTEAEWVKAARGTDLRTYPWGDEEPTCEYANYGYLDGMCSPPPGTAPVGSRPDGASPYGLYDLAGNVDEWIADCFVDALDEIIRDGIRNPIAPETPGCNRVIHGGSYVFFGPEDLKIDIRTGRNPEYSGDLVGFRCVRTP